MRSTHTDLIEHYHQQPLNFWPGTHTLAVDIYASAMTLKIVWEQQGNLSWLLPQPHFQTNHPRYHPAKSQAYGR